MVKTEVSLPTSWSLLEEAWNLFKARARTYLPIQAVGVVCLLVPLVLFVFAFCFAIIPPRYLLLEVIGCILLSVIFLVVAVFGISWGSASLFVAIKDRDKQIGARDSLRQAWHKMGSYWWILLLTFAISVGGYFFFLIPGLLFSVWFSFGIIILFVEDEKGIRALLKSREYVRGQFWAVTWRMFCIGCVYALFYWSISVFVQAMLLSVPTLSAGLASGISSEISQVLLMFSVVPLTAIYLFLLYEKLRVVRGTFVFNPHAKQEVLYTVVGIFGVACMFLLMVMIISVLTQGQR